MPRRQQHNDDNDDNSNNTGDACLAAVCLEFGPYHKRNRDASHQTGELPHMTYMGGWTPVPLAGGQTRPLTVRKLDFTERYRPRRDGEIVQQHHHTQKRKTTGFGQLRLYIIPCRNTGKVCCQSTLDARREGDENIPVFVRKIVKTNDTLRCQRCLASFGVTLFRGRRRV